VKPGSTPIVQVNELGVGQTVDQHVELRPFDVHDDLAVRGVDGRTGSTN
jgi:hypothetical protein